MNTKRAKKGVITKCIQYKKGKLILSKSQYNGVTTYTEFYYYSVKPFIITFLFIIAIVTSHLTII